MKVYKYLVLVVTVLALISFFCPAMAIVEPTNPPYLSAEKKVEPKEIWMEGTAGNITEAKVTLTVSGLGEAFFSTKPQDVIFVMDSSGSMMYNDPNAIRVGAAYRYIDRLVFPDERGTVVAFSDTAYLVNGHHLNTNASQLKEDLKKITYSAGTNLNAAIKMANRELIENGDPGKLLVEILLTDGKADPPENNVTETTIKESVDNHIITYTIGLGESIDEWLLRHLADRTGGEYYHANTTYQLIGIFENISASFHNYTAGMRIKVRDVLPSYVTYTSMSASVEPEYIFRPPDGTTVLQWGLPKLMVDEVWKVSYKIRVSKAGILNIGVNKSDMKAYYSSVEYINWNRSQVITPFPNVFLTVLGHIPPLPPIVVPPPLPVAVAPPPPPPLLPVYSPPPVMPVAVGAATVTQPSMYHLLLGLLPLAAGKMAHSLSTKTGGIKMGVAARKRPLKKEKKKKEGESGNVE